MDRTIPSVRAHDALELFLALKEARGCEPVTLRNYRTAVGRFLALPFVPESVAELTDDHVVLWLGSLRKGGLAAGTLAWHQRHVFAWIGWLVTRGEIPRDPRRGVDRVIVPRERMRSVTSEAFIRLLAVAGDRPRTKRGTLLDPENRLRDVAILHVLYATGLRRAELVGVRFEDVDLRRGELLVRHTKAKRERVVPFDAATKAALAEYVIGKRGRAPGPLFLARGGVGLSDNALRLLLERLAERAGVSVSAHDFRRGFAARVRRAGLDVGHTARLMGHSTLTMTLRYSEEGETDAAISAYRKVIG
ncbi:MAG: tyrosine-type recombinase/integrase [Dehalococcoidia bacterium]|nr:tyrosine-type recombinase/integrase [Dehalococcoidia bacterium]